MIVRLQRRLFSIPIGARIAIGSGVIVAIGAVAGTWVTHRLTESGAAGEVLVLVILAGVALVILANLLIVRLALRPLLDLRQFTEEITAEQSLRSSFQPRNPDPDTKQVSTTVKSLLDQLIADRQQVRTISMRAIHAQEEERKRISHWLHDDTGQALITLALHLERLENQVPSEYPEIRQRLSAAHNLASETLAGLRKIIYGLRPSILDDLGLVPAIRWYARMNLEEAGIQTQVGELQEPQALPAELTTTLFRIAQEAINNIVRHSQAKNATITLGCQNGEVYLRVEDDGRGFQVPHDQGEAIRMHHWGLVGIHERAELVGGSMSVSSEPGKGTLLEVHIPIGVHQP